MNLVIANEQSPLIVHGQPGQTTATNNRDKQNEPAGCPDGSFSSGGGGGIRTHGRLPFTRFPSVPIRPLSHSSRSVCYIPTCKDGNSVFFDRQKRLAFGTTPPRRVVSRGGWVLRRGILVNRVRAGTQQPSARRTGAVDNLAAAPGNPILLYGSKIRLSGTAASSDQIKFLRAAIYLRTERRGVLPATLRATSLLRSTQAGYAERNMATTLRSMNEPSVDQSVRPLATHAGMTDAYTPSTACAARVGSSTR